MTDETYSTLQNERALIADAKVDPHAFAAVYDYYFARIYNYTRYRVIDPVAADDLTSEVFERVLTKLHTYRSDRAPFAAWLFTIARNTVNANLRRRKHRQFFSLEAFRNRAGVDPDPDEVAARNETYRELLDAVRKLPARDRELIALKFTSGLTNRAISKMTGLKENHVAVILHRAVQRIRVELEEPGENP
jgi:RNA polymerase sigma-70 factor (ECF subfamily)